MSESYVGLYPEDKTSMVPGRSSGLAFLSAPSQFAFAKKWLRWLKEQIRLTASGKAPVFHRIPF
jgi:hypothetical protein